MDGLAHGVNNVIVPNVDYVSLPLWNSQIRMWTLYMQESVFLLTNSAISLFINAKPYKNIFSVCWDLGVEYYRGYCLHFSLLIYA